MRVPLSWLRDYVDVDLEPEALAERLTLLGMEVKSIERWGDEWRNVVVGELLSVEKHPRADRLSLTSVRARRRRRAAAIVCGATNIAAGQRVPVALPGAVLPGDRRIERTEKMGVVSNGMLCSGDELNLTADADGILILPARRADRGGAGRPLRRRRARCRREAEPRRRPVAGRAGSRGRRDHGRAAAVAGDGSGRGRSATSPRCCPSRSGTPAWCPRFVGRWVDGLTIGPSPDRVQMRLRAAGAAPDQQRRRRRATT